MDELQGRKVASGMRIDYIGTIGILATAYKNKLLSQEEITESIEGLKESKRHISEELYRWLITEIDSQIETV